MAKRVKSDKTNLITINDWRHADELVRAIGLDQQTIEKLEAAAARKIANVKAELADKVKGYQQDIDRCWRSLEAFALVHKDEFTRQRSRKLNFGTLGWRKSTSIKIKKATLQLIKNVFSKREAAVLIRVKESVDKDALAKLTDERLVSVKARREAKDVFFVEPDLPKAADYK